MYAIRSYYDFLNGKEDALNDDEKEGLQVFMDQGCTSCHTGIALQPEASVGEPGHGRLLRIVGILHLVTGQVAGHRLLTSPTRP